MCKYYSYIPKSSVNHINSWVQELGVEIKLSVRRRTKLGDFRVKDDKQIITINNDLNKYSFLITLTHEIAHAFVYRDYNRRVNPHGVEWKNTFRSMLLNLISINCFPEEICKPLIIYMKNPKASTFSDINLILALKKYDVINRLTISNLEEGEKFKIANGRVFIKLNKLRKRIKCIEKNSNRIYFFHPLAEINKIEI